MKQPGQVRSEEELRGLWKRVVSHGQARKDRARVRDVVQFNGCGHELKALGIRRGVCPTFFVQAFLDGRAQYKFFDALGMWIEQADSGLWKPEDVDWIVHVAKRYLGEEELLSPLSAFLR